MKINRWIKTAPLWQLWTVGFWLGAFITAVFVSVAQAQPAGPWHLTTTQCFGTTSQPNVNSQFQLNLQGNPDVSVNETTNRQLDCTAGKWTAKTFATLAECAPEATAMQSAFDTANALGYWEFKAYCWAPADTCAWLASVYPTGTPLPQDVQDYITANCPASP